MFDSVNKKLQMAQYFFDNLRALANEANGFAYISGSKRVQADANLDGFFFELISAKDFYLQEVNRKFSLGLRSKDVSEDNLLNCIMPDHVRGQVRVIKGLLSDRSNWLWKINHYRNVATHHRLFGRGFVANSSSESVRVYLFEDPDEPDMGNSDMEILSYCEASLAKLKKFLSDFYAGL